MKALDGSKFATELIVGSLLLCLGGCGDSSTYPIVPVTGTIKYEDGTLIPATRITLKFVSDQPPLDAKTHPRPGVGEVNVEDGSFVVSTYDYDDGLISGTHKVTALSLDERNLPSDAIPKLYRVPESSPLTVDTTNSPFELKVKKP